MVQQLQKAQIQFLAQSLQQAAVLELLMDTQRQTPVVPGVLEEVVLTVAAAVLAAVLAIRAAIRRLKETTAAPDILTDLILVLAAEVAVLAALVVTGQNQKVVTEATELHQALVELQ